VPRSLKLSSRSQIAPFLVMEVMRAAERIELAGGDVVHLEVGQPSTPAPQGVRSAAMELLESNVLGYTTPLGHPQLREAIAHHGRRIRRVRTFFPGRIRSG